MNLVQESFIYNEKHLSQYYFDFEKRGSLLAEDIFVFSRVIEIANELISKINELSLEDSLKELKFKEIKEKISNCHSLSLALEYYSDFELELHKINSGIKEYSDIRNTRNNTYCDVEQPKEINKTKSSDSEDNILIIDTETNFVSKNLMHNNKKSIVSNDNIVDLNKEKDIQYYIDKYNAKTGASKDYIINIFSNI